MIARIIGPTVGWDEGKSQPDWAFGLGALSFVLCASCFVLRALCFVLCASCFLRCFDAFEI